MKYQVRVEGVCIGYRFIRIYDLSRLAALTNTNSSTSSTAIATENQKSQDQENTDLTSSSGSPLAVGPESLEGSNKPPSNPLRLSLAVPGSLGLISEKTQHTNTNSPDSTDSRPKTVQNDAESNQDRNDAKTRQGNASMEGSHSPHSPSSPSSTNSRNGGEVKREREQGTGGVSLPELPYSVTLALQAAPKWVFILRATQGYSGLFRAIQGYSWSLGWFESDTTKISLQAIYIYIILLYALLLYVCLSVLSMSR